MSNWYGAARSNYVHVANMPALIEALAPWPIIISPYGEDPNFVCFLSGEQDSGGWPCHAEDPETGDDLEFDPEELILPFLAEGQVLILVESGAEKLRCITGNALAYCAGKPLVQLNLHDIYAMAAKAFDVPLASITLAEY